MNEKNFTKLEDEPFKENPTSQGQRRYYKRIRKKRVKNWMKNLGMNASGKTN